MTTHRFCLVSLICYAEAACMPTHPAPPAHELIHVLVSIVNGANDSLLADVLAPNYERTADPLSESARGIEGMRVLVRKMRLDMPDLHVTVTDEITHGDRAAIRWELSGTDSGPGDYPPTGRHATAVGMSFFWIKNGRLEREWTSWTASRYSPTWAFAWCHPERIAPRS